MIARFYLQLGFVKEPYFLKYCQEFIVTLCPKFQISIMVLLRTIEKSKHTFGLK